MNAKLVPLPTSVVVLFDVYGYLGIIPDSHEYKYLIFWPVY